MASGSKIASSGNQGNHINTFDRIPKVNSPLRLGNGFTASSNAWDGNGSIWANGNKPTPFTDGAVDLELRTGSASNLNGDAYYLRNKTGSGSLLSSSESEGWKNRSNVPWSTTTNSTSSASARPQGQALSSVHPRSGENVTRGTDLQPNNRDMSSYFLIDQQSRLDTSNYGPRENSLHPTSSPHHRNIDSASLLNSYSDSHEEEKRRNVNAAAWRTNNSAHSIQSGLRFLNSNTENASLPLGKHHQQSISPKSRNNFELPETHQRSSLATIPTDLRHHSSSHTSHRQPASTHRSFSGVQGRALQFDGQEDELSARFHTIDLQAEMISQDYISGFRSQDQMQRATYNLDRSPQSGFGRPKYYIGSEDMGLAGRSPTSSHAAADTGSQYLSEYQRSMSFDNRDTSSPAASDYRKSLSSPFYSTNGGTPPTGPESMRSTSGSGLSNHPSNNQMFMLDREPRMSRLFHSEDRYMLPAPSQARMPHSQPYDFGGGYSGALRLNPLAVPYPVPVYPGLPAPYSARYPSREHDSSQIVRSALLEDFRANHKTSKRYELKDICGHVVEFSGDQHGSRFIQQKLETANSDEKDQIFAEIQPNSLQLMTDVFGNYVIQKLFEHGNQTQKRVLANQMKNRVMDLSTQMYGCRVVQKALEHILTDQQASMVKELEAHVLKCVKDQNGNHVIQKAIERVPAEHIQFIVNAFTGQVNRLAAHPYGCRVIQRMLEHCEDRAIQSILHELHTGLHSLIIDQYGNYVIQHVIEKGHEEDRTRVVSTVTSQLLTFSKHKFASNVVEKSIQCAEASQRAKILEILTTPNEKGESPLLGLMRDQYGNYVIQKSLGESGFKDDERKLLVEHCKPEFTKLKRFSSGKQVVALEKLIYDGEPEPDLSSSQSSTIPSANVSTVEGPTILTLPPVQIFKTSLGTEAGTTIASTP